MTIIYNHNEKSMREENSSSKGLLGYDRDDKTFACEASDFECARIKDIPNEFNLKIEENGHTKKFTFVRSEYTNDADHELISYNFTGKDGYKFIIFND